MTNPRISHCRNPLCGLNPCESSTGLRLQTLNARYLLARPAQESRADVCGPVALGSSARFDRAVMPRCVPIPKRFDGARLETLAVSEREFFGRADSLSSNSNAALERAIDNVQRSILLTAPTPVPGDDARSPLRADHPTHRKRSVFTCRLARPLYLRGHHLAVSRAHRGCPHRILCNHQREMGAQIPQCS